ncbi:hypothetical protein EXN66_Car022178 [Channa argus]|uniref:Ig-like domain-containing protein n=1 Tax=Channa argus TaxID=215402 RepID=A0A6G1QWN7_CHAAH|nr:hypothetical protein EXN66_Car022178 [Channa argus]
MSNAIFKNQARGPWFTCTCDPTAAVQQAALHMQSYVVIVVQFITAVECIFRDRKVTWATDPPSDLEALVNSTIKTTDIKGLFSVESALRVVGSLSNYTYFCFFESADKTQVWTASWKNQESITQEEGHALSIPCIHQHNLQNFSLTWTLTSFSESRVIMKYDSRARHTFNLWEGQAKLDQDLLLLGNGSLLLHKPHHEENTGLYTCTFSGLQNRHIIQTKVNITVASISVDEQSVQRSWWSTAASAAFVLFTILVALPQCIKQRVIETRIVSHTCNGAGRLEGGPHKDLNTVASYTVGQNGAECNRLLLQVEAQDEPADHAPETEKDFEEDSVASPPEDKTEQDEKPTGPPVEGNGGLQCSGLEKD